MNNDKNKFDLGNNRAVIIHVDVNQYLVSRDLISSPIITTTPDGTRTFVETNNTRYIVHHPITHQVWSKYRLDNEKKALNMRLARQNRAIRSRAPNSVNTNVT